MHINKVTKEIRNKVIAGVMIFIVAIGCFVGYKHQQNKINELQMKLEMKQDVDHKNQGMYSTAMDVQTIQNKFNELNSYKVFDGSMVLKHKYEYQRDSFLGLKSKGTLVANAKVYYEYKVDLKDAKISVNGNTINITLPRATLNRDSIHMMNNTFKVVEKETNDNILMNEKDGKLLQRYWIESFSVGAIDKLEEYYDSGAMRDKLENYAKREVESLINTLGLNRVDIKIEIK